MSVSRSIFEMITQIIEFQLCTSKKNGIGRLCSLVDVANSTVRGEALDSYFKCGLVGRFSGDFTSLLRHFFGRSRLRLLMQVIGIDIGKTQIPDQNFLTVRRGLD